MFVPEALWKRRGMPEVACGKSVGREVVKDPARPSGAILDRMHSAAVHTRIPKVLVPSCGQGLVIIRNGNLQDLVSARATDSDFHRASNTNSSPSSNAAATIDVPFSKLRKRRTQVSNVISVPSPVIAAQLKRKRVIRMTTTCTRRDGVRRLSARV